MINLITTSADYNAIRLPGRISIMKDYTVMALPSDATEANLLRKWPAVVQLLVLFTPAYRRINHEYSSLLIILINLIFMFSL